MNRAIANQRVNLYGIAPEADYKDYLLNEFYYSINGDTVKTGSYSIPISKFNALVNGKIIFLKETREEQPMANNLPAVKTECAVISITPKEQIEQASEMSRLLKDIVTKAGLSRKLGGTKEHLDYEAWATIARWHHCTPSTEWTRPIKNGDEIIGWEARVNVLDDQGRVIGSSEGMCMADEKNWNGKPSYALRSMAQTRTAGKALRSLFAHVAVLAGYSPTPAEEMDGVDNRNHTEAKYTPPPSAPPSSAPENGQPADAATDKQRKMIYAKGMTLWNDKKKAAEFMNWLKEQAGFDYFTKKYASECIEDFDSRAADFDADYNAKDNDQFPV